MSETADQPPEGFARVEIAAGFAADFGAIYAKRVGDQIWYGFRVGEEHLNPHGSAHGGALATFADMQLAVLMRTGVLEAKQAPTISLALDYLAPVRLGDWVWGEVKLVKRTGRIAFTETLLTVADAPVVRATAMFAHSERSLLMSSAEVAPKLVDREAPIPQGFTEFSGGPGFGEKIGAVYGRADPAGPKLGFRVERRHVNLFGFCHGGALATIADYQIGALKRAGLVQGPFSPTLRLAIDYVSAAKFGEWIEADVRLIRATGRYIFTEAVLSGDNGPVARSSLIYAQLRGRET